MAEGRNKPTLHPLDIYASLITSDFGWQIIPLASPRCRLKTRQHMILSRINEPGKMEPIIIPRNSWI